jgi:nicotinate-nucleotide--dimethylbenzimidazole phosphoribosyltransferase
MIDPTDVVIAPLDAAAMSSTEHRWWTRAIPPGALGRLQSLAVHLSGITGSSPPAIVRRPAVAVFAADHGVVADGASAWPQAVTGYMAATMVSGGAAINQFASLIGATVTVVDVGMATPAPDGVVNRRIRSGTNSLARGAAMTLEHADEAIAVGVSIAHGLVERGADCLVGGEMGIGNTTAAASAMTPSTITGTRRAAAAR